MADGAQELIAMEAPGAAPVEYRLKPKESFTPQTVYAVFDGSAAGGTFLPCCTIYSQDGRVLARSTPGEVVAGDVAEVTFGPFLQTPSEPSGVIPPPGPIVGWNAYAIYAAGAAGNFVIPPSAKLILAVCVGGGGGGGGGHRSGAAATATGGGRGGGGGACTIAWHDAQRLASLYPGGVPYQVGLGGLGGAVDLPGGNGGLTSFGEQSGGGGGGGTAGTNANNTNAGSGGGVTSAALGTAGLPFVAGSPGFGVGNQAMQQVGSGSWPGPAEYGGAAGSAGVNGVAAGTPYPGNHGGYSLWGGGGGGGGAAWSNVGAQKGGAGGASGSYTRTLASGDGTGSAGTLTGHYAGSGGDGGDAQTVGGANATTGKGGSIGAGGGGGGSAGTAAAAAGGDGGGGQLYIYIFG